MISGPYILPPTTYRFVDGESLNQTLLKVGEKYFGRIKPPVDWFKFRGQCRKVFYYDAVSVQRPDEDNNTYASRVEPKRTELAYIEGQAAYHVRTGDVRHRRKRGNEQKMVDVQLAVDALLMASRGLFSDCDLITGDLDFRPLVIALVDMGVNVRLFYPPGETNNDLMTAADQAIAMKIDVLSGWISDKFEGKNALPQGSFNFRDTAQPTGERLAEWNDVKYGLCHVKQNATGIFELFTEFSPSYPDTHRLELKGRDASALRTYAEELYDLIVPTW